MTEIIVLQGVAAVKTSATHFIFYGIFDLHGFSIEAFNASS
ncbi:16142_t:CDS:1, partial [Cetraspora pellucida]